MRTGGVRTNIKLVDRDKKIIAVTASQWCVEERKVFYRKIEDRKIGKLKRDGK